MTGLKGLATLPTRPPFKPSERKYSNTAWPHVGETSLDDGRNVSENRR
jgi:hypothetical protein